MLVGIVKKNAIMMIDFAIEAQRTEAKRPRRRSSRRASSRFRPIMMTTMAALMGSLPIALALGRGRRGAAAAGPRGRRRPRRVADADALHHAGDLSLLERVQQWFATRGRQPPNRRPLRHSPPSRKCGRGDPAGGVEHELAWREGPAGAWGALSPPAPRHAQLHPSKPAHAAREASRKLQPEHSLRIAAATLSRASPASAFTRLQASRHVADRVRIVGAVQHVVGAEHLDAQVEHVGREHHRVGIDLAADIPTAAREIFSRHAGMLS